MNEWIKQWMIYMNEWLIEWLNGWMNEFILRERREKYQSMDSTKKTELLTKLHDNYITNQLIQLERLNYNTREKVEKKIASAKCHQLNHALHNLILK